MRRVTVFTISFVICAALLPLSSFADFVHFVDYSKMRAERTKCYKIRDKYEEKCTKIADPGDEQKCRLAALSKLMACQKNADNKGIVKFSKWPEKAQKEVMKLFKKQNKAFGKCLEKSSKCIAKCSKKAKGDEKKFDTCVIKSDCDRTFSECMEAAGEKYSINNSKKLKKLLKGKKPA